MARRYAVITPVYNEAEFLPQVAASLADQDEPPLAWIVVDDRSTDNTWEVLQSLAEGHSFIRPVRMCGDDARRVGANVVRVFNQGLATFEDEVEYLVKMDADVLLEPDYFATVMDLFEADPELGMASGKTYVENNGEWVLERCPDSHVVGPCKTYRGTCFNEMGGLYPLLGWDILDNAKARMLGWKTRSRAELVIRHLRLMGSAKGMMTGRLRTGRAMYTIRAHPLFVIAKSLFRALERPYLYGLLIPLGYWLSFLKGYERLADPELAAFLRREQLGRILGRTAKDENFRVKKLKDSGQ